MKLKRWILILGATATLCSFVGMARPDEGGTDKKADSYQKEDSAKKKEDSAKKKKAKKKKSGDEGGPDKKTAIEPRHDEGNPHHSTQDTAANE